MARCARCGVENPEGSRFCGGCGRPLGEAVVPARRRSFGWLWGLLLVLAVGALGYVGYSRGYLQSFGKGGELRLRPSGVKWIQGGHAGGVLSVAFSPNGQLLASGSLDETVKLWRVSDGTLLRTLTGHGEGVTSVAFSPDGQLLASGRADSTINLWRVSDGTLLRTLTGHKSFVTSVAFSPDGHLLASGSRDNTVKLWRVADGMLLQTYDQETGTGVLCVRFSPDGRLLAYGRVDATVMVRSVN